eukprot:scaffold114920_cov63-Phaeocystis_antarctica.AAC.1
MALLGSMATTAVLLQPPGPAFAAETLLEAHAEPVPPMPPMHAEPAYAEPGYAEPAYGAPALAEPALAAQVRADPRMLAILASPALGGIHAPTQAEPVHAAAASACVEPAPAEPSRLEPPTLASLQAWAKAPAGRAALEAWKEKKRKSLKEQQEKGVALWEAAADSDDENVHFAPGAGGATLRAEPAQVELPPELQVAAALQMVAPPLQTVAAEVVEARATQEAVQAGLQAGLQEAAAPVAEGVVLPGVHVGEAMHVGEVMHAMLDASGQVEGQGMV